MVFCSGRASSVCRVVWTALSSKRSMNNFFWGATWDLAIRKVSVVAICGPCVSYSHSCCGAHDGVNVPEPSRTIPPPLESTSPQISPVCGAPGCTSVTFWSPSIITAHWLLIHHSFLRCFQLRWHISEREDVKLPQPFHVFVKLCCLCE